MAFRDYQLYRLSTLRTLQTFTYHMHITWLGQTCVKLQTKHLDEDVVVLLDAYKPSSGDFPRSFSSHLALYSRGRENSATISQNPFVLDTLGECEIKEVLVTAWPTDSGTIVFKLNAENLSLVHLGRMNKKPDLSALEKIGIIDVLFVPVGGGQNYLSPEDASTLVSALEPRIIIPIGYHCDTDKDALPLTAFIKEMGLKPDITDKKIILKKKDLPQGETKLIVLEKNI